jgi:hypothetical protein
METLKGFQLGSFGVFFFFFFFCHGKKERMRKETWGNGQGAGLEDRRMGF